MFTHYSCGTSKDIKEFGEAFSVDYIAEPVRGAAIPEYKQVKEDVLAAGAFWLPD